MMKIRKMICLTIMTAVLHPFSAGAESTDFNWNAIPDYRENEYVTLGEYRGLTVEVDPSQFSGEDAEEQKYEYIRLQLIQQAWDNAEISGYSEEAKEHELSGIRSYYEKYADEYGMSLSEFLEYSGTDADEFYEEIDLMAENKVRMEMVLLAIADAEGIEVSEEEYNEGIAEYAAGYEMTVDELLAINGEEYLRFSVQRSKVEKFLYENANIIVIGEDEENRGDTEETGPEEETESKMYIPFWDI
ncbi:MAG: hypothetical protein Q4B01_08905 [Eubacteriales bacterium]|nr:hypothetical protein [Eubacteriales bacterium]